MSHILTKFNNVAVSLSVGVLGLFCFLAVGVSGCVTEPPLNTDAEVPQEATQENLGLGIVLGTSGYQKIEKDSVLPEAYAQTIEGQVRKIEGAAYVVQDITEHEYRIPFDQNTTIDRPAHVGDWIQAFLDERGRSIHIRNIDKKIKAKQEP
ncbi:hypothetical protein [Candidatus Nitronereus thalassa]|uniref:DUF3221 domain-containing protein n=1 Tax=Candidatus Nitronereus thalassa TaxID=3020898 RepID=A0ABU3K9K6_9BACT|nr:hypothetical protein [Candidatus Nitronereus thalassa]MDT7043091.1 hypothetical protein [Candidatus Nitronereus thalassa]